MGQTQIKKVLSTFVTSLSIATGLHSWYMTRDQYKTLEAKDKLVQATQDCIVANENLDKVASHLNIRETVIQTKMETFKSRLLSDKQELLECVDNIIKDKNIEYNKIKMDKIMGNQIENAENISKKLDMPKEEFIKIVNEGFNSSKNAEELLSSNSQAIIDIKTQLADSAKDLDKPLESNVLPPLVDYFDNLNHFLRSLTLEQHACFVNGLGFFLVFLTLNSLVSAYFGNKIVNYFKLDIKYPRLAKIIEYRSKFLNYYFILNILLLYFITIFFIITNIFFFFNQYY